MDRRPAAASGRRLRSAGLPAVERAGAPDRRGHPARGHPRRDRNRGGARQDRPGASTRRPVQEPRLPDGGQRDRRDVARPDRTRRLGWMPSMSSASKCSHGTGATLWEGWSDVIAPYAQALETHGAKPRLWVTGAGFSTWRHDERGQIRAFLGAAEAPVERVYWSSLQDLDPLSIAPKASTRTSATISTASSGPTARPSCWAACWNRAASPPSARFTGSAARCR